MKSQKQVLDNQYKANSMLHDFVNMNSSDNSSRGRNRAQAPTEPISMQRGDILDQEMKNPTALREVPIQRKQKRNEDNMGESIFNLVPKEKKKTEPNKDMVNLTYDEYKALKDRALGGAAKVSGHMQMTQETKIRRKDPIPQPGELNRLAERNPKDFLKENRMAAIHNEMKRDKSVHESEGKSKTPNAKHKYFGQVPKQ